MNIQKRIFSALLFVLLVPTVLFSQHNGNMPVPVVNYSVGTNWQNSIPAQNSLTGYLGEYYNNNLNKRLLNVDEKALVEGFTNRPGKHRWIGEHIGKYLESAVNTWLVTKNKALKEQMDRMAYTLVSAQLPDGYLGTYLPENYWTSWDVWSHKYNLVGLLAYYRVTGDSKILESAKKIGDLMVRVFGDTENKRNIVKSGSHVGMAATSIIDPMVDLYMWTGNRNYLEFCNYIIRSYKQEGGPDIIESLLSKRQVNKVANAKAYEMLSNLVGVLKLYRITGEEKLLEACKIAFDDIASKRLYLTGTISDHERFVDDFVLQSDTAAHMGEGCVTVTWIQFNMQLLSITGDIKYVNEIEKTVYNHLIGAQNPQTGCVSYYTPLIGEKPYSCNITCCLSSIPRGISLIPYINYGKLHNKPTIFFYESARIADTVTTSENKKVPVVFVIDSKFPEKGQASIQVQTESRQAFNVLLRKPDWVKSFTVSVNGKMISGTGEIFSIEREWKNGDVINVSFDIPVSTIDGGLSYPGYIAFKRGPQILAVDASFNSTLNIKSNPEFKIVSDLKKAEKVLPVNWIGKQAYSIRILDKSRNSKSLILVPYAQAGQTNGFVSVWIKAGKMGSAKNF